MNDNSKGELMHVDQVVVKAELPRETVARILRSGHVEFYKIGNKTFVYYREFLRGAWEYERNKRPGGRPRKGM